MRLDIDDWKRTRCQPTKKCNRICFLKMCASSTLCRINDSIRQGIVLTWIRSFCLSLSLSWKNALKSCGHTAPDEWLSIDGILLMRYCLVENTGWIRLTIRTIANSKQSMLLLIIKRNFNFYFKCCPHALFWLWRSSLHLTLLTYGLSCLFSLVCFGFRQSMYLTCYFSVVSSRHFNYCAVIYFKTEYASMFVL